jgi:ribose-phosphate pyrophosphokinase
LGDLIVFAGSANQALARRVTERLGVAVGRATVGRFSDGEVMVEVDENVRGRDVFIVQSTCAPTNDHLMELLVLADAIKRASARRVTAVIPYFGYARQDRRPRSARVAITAKVVADMIAGVGIDRLLTVDLHADQIQGFFDMPVDNLYGSDVFVDDFVGQRYGDVVVVSPDVGGVARARGIARRLNDADIAIIDKRRARANESEVMNIVGDVDGRTAIVIDDIVDTAGTLCGAAAALKARGSPRVVAYVTHAVLSGPAIERIEASALDELVVTDSIPLRDGARACCRIRQLTLDRMLAESIRRVNNEESLSVMFKA